MRRLLYRVANKASRLLAPPPESTPPAPLSPIEARKAEIGKARTLPLGNRGTVFIGRWTYYGTNTRFSSFHPHETLAIGPFCSIADGAHFLLSSGHHAPQQAANFPVDTFFHESRQRVVQPNYTRLGGDVWVGADVTILPGVRIGNGAVIAAGSVVTKDVPPFAIVGGNPAGFLRWRFEDAATREALHQIAWWEWSEAEITARRDFFRLPVEEAIGLAESSGWKRAPGIPASYLDEIGGFFGVDVDTAALERFVRDFLYRDDNAHLIHQYKSQSYENLAVWKVMLETVRPRCIVELGTMYGCSAKLLTRMAALMGLETRFITIDIRDNVTERVPEAEYVLEDFTGNMAAIWERWNPDIVFQDAHMYALIKEQIEVGRRYPHTLHAFHDVGHRLYQRHMSIPTSAEPTGATGSWERHVLGEYAPALLDIPNRQHEDERLKIHIFDSTGDNREFGLGLLRHKTG